MVLTPKPYMGTLIHFHPGNKFSKTELYDIKDIATGRIRTVQGELIVPIKKNDCVYKYKTLIHLYLRSTAKNL